MEERNVIWSPAVKEKLIQFRSERFTTEETFDFITQFILETEKLLGNSIIRKSYIEENGEFKGISRVVIKKFRVYYKLIGNEAIILAILFPGEN
ncbi:hypothetical protein KO561_16185 [Radiobacillus kanasensis]|uniref:hypothetical protein n=1 Tax=Radiobacillus kanasensis TaxID=2844358 RepID=UPI001E45FBB0|nr:hypothetical protein [Radiobacillus kanasensis]UFT98717.1 hypothetical protein KO561_16185 [Radiobacillus kanasensis]